MDRLEKIKKFANQKEMERIKKENEILERIEKYKERIKTLEPRIKELLKVGRTCLEYGIPLTGYKWGNYPGYEEHHFISNRCSHLTGFVSELNPKRIVGVGKEGGGACHWNLITDGKFIDVKGDTCDDVEFVLRRFLEDFEKFETKFYEYVDNITL